MLQLSVSLYKTSHSRTNGPSISSLIRGKIVYFIERVGRVIAIATEPRYLTGRDGWHNGVHWHYVPRYLAVSHLMLVHASKYTYEPRSMCASNSCTCIDVHADAAKVEVLSPGSQVPRCTPIAKSSPLWELHSECILHPAPRFGLIHRKTRRFPDISLQNPERSVKFFYAIYYECICVYVYFVKK